MIVSVSISDAELKELVKKAVAAKMPGNIVQNVAIIRHENDRNPDTFEAKATVVPDPKEKQGTPATPEKPITAELRDWTYLNGAVHGTIFGDTRGRFQDGDVIRTAKGVISGDILTTNNSTYKLIGEGRKL